MLGLTASLATLTGGLLTGCKTPPIPADSNSASTEGSSTASIGTGAALEAGATPVPLPPPSPSSASNPRAYRKDAAQHLYAHNAARIFHGQLPPQLYAVGVLNTEIDRNGKVVALHWLRAPRHVPAVMAEIERTVRAASPYPSPTRMGKVTYTDTWLWDRSGRFQLDTLTEGQQ